MDTMAAQPQPWIDQSLALLEQMENERGGLARALLDIESRIEQVHHSVDRTDVLLDELEERSERVQKARRELRARQDAMARAQEELWQRLMLLRQDRERMRSAERRLSLDATIVENQGAGLPDELSVAEANRRELEHKLANLNVLRRDVAMELARLEVEMNRMVNQLEAIAEAEESRDAAGDVAAMPLPSSRAPRLRLVTGDEGANVPTRSIRPVKVAISADDDEPSRVTTLRFSGDLEPDSELFREDEDPATRDEAHQALLEQSFATFSSAWTPEMAEVDEEKRVSFRPPWLAWSLEGRRPWALGGAAALAVITAFALALGGRSGNPGETAAASLAPAGSDVSAADEARPITVIQSAPVEPERIDFGGASAPTEAPSSAEPRSEAAPSSAAGASTASRSSTSRSPRSRTPAAARAKRPSDATDSKTFAKVQLRSDDDPLAGL